MVNAEPVNRIINSNISWILTGSPFLIPLSVVPIICTDFCVCVLRSIKPLCFIIVCLSQNYQLSTYFLLVILQQNSNANQTSIQEDNPICQQDKQTNPGWDGDPQDLLSYSNYSWIAV